MVDKDSPRKSKRVGSKLYYCPYCAIPRAWIMFWFRNDHIKRNHPNAPRPKSAPNSKHFDGSGLEQWREIHDPRPPLPDLPPEV